MGCYNLFVLHQFLLRALFNSFGAPANVGEWLSLVEHLVRDQGVGGSNPLSPTNLSLAHPTRSFPPTFC